MSTTNEIAADLSSIAFHHDAWGHLLLQQPGQNSPIPVEPVRAFPLTHPTEFVSLLDPEGHEVLRIKSLHDLPSEQQKILQHELSEREFSPVILRILEVSSSSPPCTWDVETDRGRTQFTFDSEDDLRRLPDGTVIVADGNGVRYRIPQIDRLDHSSRTNLRRFH